MGYDEYGEVRVSSEVLKISDRLADYCLWDEEYFANNSVANALVLKALLTTTPIVAGRRQNYSGTPENQRAHHRADN